MQLEHHDMMEAMYIAATSYSVATHIPETETPPADILFSCYEI